MKRMVLAAAAVGLSLLESQPAHAAEITLLLLQRAQDGDGPLTAPFEKASGHKLAIVYGSTGTLKGRIDKDKEGLRRGDFRR